MMDMEKFNMTVSQRIFIYVKMLELNISRNTMEKVVEMAKEVLNPTTARKYGKKILIVKWK